MDMLSDILSVMKLRGTLYFRTAFTAPWGIEVPSYENVARFHYAHRGRCWVRVGEAKGPLLLNQGDLVIIPHGARHVIGDPSDTGIATLEHVLEASGFTGEGALVYGDGGDRHATELICGHFAFESEFTHPLISALPACIHVKNYGGAAHQWLDQTLKLISSEVAQPGLGGDLIALKLSETICAQAIRAFLAAEGKDHPVSAGFTDPRICAALQALHRDPSAPWTLDMMAREAGQSRSAFADRFRRVMGQAPLEYLTHWRMLTARRMLAETVAPIISVAERSGYHSEAAFGRAFKRHFGRTPASVRRLH
jgi:AraC-like DNA-binding protein